MASPRGCRQPDVTDIFLKANGEVGSNPHRLKKNLQAGPPFSGHVLLPYISMSNVALAPHKLFFVLFPCNEVNLFGPSERLAAEESRCKMDLG